MSDQERSTAKVICLGIIYGMGPHAAAAKLNIEGYSHPLDYSHTLWQFLHSVQQQKTIDIILPFRSHTYTYTYTHIHIHTHTHTLPLQFPTQHPHLTMIS